MSASDKQPDGKAAGRDRPWLMRTYAGHSTAAASNALYRKNLEKGQTGLSIAFDLPTQTGYDSDHILARGEVGKVGVPIGHIGDMETLLAAIPLDRMNTSMTINATAPWLLALYIAVAERRGLARKALSGTTQNDVIKEYLARGTYIFPPAASLKLTGDVIAFAVAELPRWNPVNICSYHLQEACATPVQELAYALAAAIAVLDSVKASGQLPDALFPRVVGRISFFVNAGLRFVTELCKMRAFTRLWDRICRERYGVEDPALRRFRYGVQVNSLGLTEQQPENNVYRILIGMLAVTLSKDARARAVQLPAWNEALGLPRPWDQQWSLRLQQILAFETDLLEYGDLFDGSPVIEEKVAALCAEAEAELARIEAMGGAVAAVENAAMKRALVESAILRTQAIESGGMTVVGVNAFTRTEPSPLTANAGDSGTRDSSAGDSGTRDSGAMTVDPAAEAEQIEGLKAWRAGRDSAAAGAALNRLESVAAAGGNLMEASIACAHAGVTTGEWGAALRRVLGEYRAPTGLGAGLPAVGESGLAGVRRRIEALTAGLGRRPKMLVGKPGLDGHSNGAEQIAVRARDCGFEVVYEGIRLTPEEIVNAALEEGVHVVGLSILSGSHLVLVEEILRLMRAADLGAVPLVVGGIVPPEDAAQLRAAGVAAVYTPKDFDLTAIMADIAGLLEDRRAAA